MKKLILISCILFLSSCNKDCEQMLKELESDYIRALENANGNPSAIDNASRIYNERKADLNC